MGGVIRTCDESTPEMIREAIIRLVGAVPAEQHDEWAEQRRYLGLEALKNARAVLTLRTTNDHDKEVPAELITATINA